ncbi:mobile mystery protein B [Halobacteriovorax sp. ZH2_bin.1]|uniref:mobile mystery protein B n=1 Tax=unclassified Halobacteriovorax TaxID=2639665 RepID=UPI00371B589E
MSILFKDRDGQTPITHEERQGLKSKIIDTMGELDELEEKNIEKGLLWLRNKKTIELEDVLSSSFLCELHKKLFGDVWDWAGRYRTTARNIGVDHYNIHKELNDLFENVKTWIEYQSYSNAEIIARFHHKLVYIHPFPNGNGRTSRILTNELSLLIAGTSPSWQRSVSPKERRETYIKALRAADDRKYEYMIEYFKEVDNT